MRKFLIAVLLASGCTQYGPRFIDCSELNNTNLALDIAIEKMDSIADVVGRTDFICKNKRPMTNVECYLARLGDPEFGNRGMIVMNDKYAGECVIHELYHVQLGQTLGTACSQHAQSCGWDKSWLEELLDEYARLKE